jgi:hypothetical protein
MTVLHLSNCTLQLSVLTDDAHAWLYRLQHHVHALAVSADADLHTTPDAKGTARAQGIEVRCHRDMRVIYDLPCHFPSLNTHHQDAKGCVGGHRECDMKDRSKTELRNADERRDDAISDQNTVQRTMPATTRGQVVSLTTQSSICHWDKQNRYP